MLNIIIKSLFLYLVFFSNVFANQNFDHWLKKFQTTAVESGIAKKVVYEIMSSAKFLPKVIEYDRFQPEFYEDTKTYIGKRTSKQKLPTGWMGSVPGLSTTRTSLVSLMIFTYGASFECTATAGSCL